MQDFIDPSPDFNFSTDWQPSQADPQPQERQPTSEMERFWTIAGNWGEFGLYFGLGLSVSLIVRAIPVLQPSALILIPAVGAGMVALGFAAPSGTRVRYQVLMVATTAAIIGANWDAWIAWFATNAWKIGTSMLLVGAAIYLIPVVGGKKHD